MHLAEPGCAVTAVELERYEHYVKFLAEIKVRWASWGEGAGQGCCKCGGVRVCALVSVYKGCIVFGLVHEGFLVSRE